MSATALQGNSPAGVREIALTRGYVATVDAADYERLAAWKWHALVCKSGRVYAKSTRRVGRGEYRDVLMHRLVLDAPAEMKVDHVEGIGLDNRRANLRLATHQQNLCNRRRGQGASAFLGVARHRSGWRAYITAHGKAHHLGLFATEEQAARARDSAALRLHGEYASLNFPAGAAPSRRLAD